MDQVTQQNAAMVEEQTAASHTLSQETGELSRLVSRFRVAGTAAASQPPVRQASRAAAAPKAAVAGNTALKVVPEEEGWEEF